MKRRLLPALLVASALPFVLAASGCPSNAGDAAPDTTVPFDGAVVDTTTPTDTGGGTPDSGGTDGTDTQDTATPPVDAGEARWAQPSGTATISFVVDDRANETYADGEIQWTGSFVWSSADNTIVYATSWLPTDGPFPLLYDDGPISQGGHEMAGAAAGDHIFSTEVWLDATEDTLIEYGALNEFGNWIWIGPNGTLEVPAGSTDRFDLAGMVIPPFGDVDMKVTLDAGALHEEFAASAPKSVWIKGSMNSWTPLQLLDDGQGGDEAASDGVYSYVHGDKLGPHDGKLRLGQEAQFVFVLVYSEGGPDEGVEYKVEGNAAAEGIAAWSDWETAGTWTPEELLLREDSKGKTLNTAIIVGDDENLPTGCISDADCLGQECDKVTGDCVDVEPVGCTGDGDCGPDQTCNLGTGECEDEVVVPGPDPLVVLIDPASGPAIGGTSITIAGTDFQQGASVDFGGQAATNVSVQGTEAITCTTPAHAPGSVAVTVTNPDGGSNSVPSGFEFLDEAEAPSVTKVEPPTGSVTGGTAVTISGQNFGANAIVTFDGKQATEVAVQNANTISAKTPTHAVGKVDVKVTNGDGQSATLAAAFEYVPNQPDWVGLLDPLAATVFEDQATALLRGQIYEAGITEAPGEGGGVTAETGYGPTGTDPYGNGWTWTEAGYQGDFENNDVYGGTLTVALAGTYDFALRFSVNGGDSWLVADSDGAAVPSDYSAGKSGKLTVKAVPTTPAVLSMSPSVASVAGGTKVTLEGVLLSGATSVLVDGESVAIDSGSDTAVVFTAPAHDMGPVAIGLKVGGDTVDAGQLMYGLVLSPAVDGIIGASEYPSVTLLATNGVESSWGAGNVLTTLHAAFDHTNLYIAIEGTTEATNAMVVYVDRDFGAGTGPANMGMLSDNDGALDASLQGGLDITVAGFGADVAAGTVGMQSVKAADGLSDFAGWRGLTPSDDFSWLTGDVVAGDGVVEMAIPLATLYPTGVPASGAALAIVVRITFYGDGYANQALPVGASGAGDVQQTDASVITVYGD